MSLLAWNENALIIFKDNLYNFNGELSIRYDDEYQIDISNIDVNSPDFPDNVIFAGTLIFVALNVAPL